jgi:hypothetical protein
MGRQPEPCSVCGDDTAAGSPHYSDRRIFADGTGRPVFLCATCAERAVAARRKGGGMTDDERRELEKGAAVFGAFAPGGH